MIMKTLIIEDDKDIADLIKIHLQDMDLDMQVHCCSDGLQGWREVKSHHYDLVLLDLMLPSLNGLEICKRIRGQIESYIPIIMLTSKSGELDRVLGLELGADDYLSKPFSLMELIARVKAQLRRSEALLDHRANTQIKYTNLDIETANRQVQSCGKNIELTAREFDLLVHFAKHPGRVFSRLQLLDRVWGESHEGYEHTVNTHINRLRNKIEPDPRHPTYIKTVWGVGYQFSDSV